MLELCYVPFEHRGRLARRAGQPPATLLVLPNGWVKVAAAIAASICADLRRATLVAGLAGVSRGLAERGQYWRAAPGAIDDESLTRRRTTWRAARNGVHVLTRMEAA